MILEVAILHVILDQTAEFEAAFQKAQAIISASKGYISHDLKKCLAKPNQYLLLINWETLEDHEIGFRKSPAYQDWKAFTSME